MSKIKFMVAFVLLIIMCTGVAGAMWSSSMYITALPASSDGNSPPPPPATYVRIFGVDGNATDGFDRDYDVTAPPAPTVDALDTYFPCSHEVVTRLATDMKADADTITWTLKVTVPSGSTVDMNWDVSNSPSDKTLVMNNGSASIDMKTQSSTTFETGSYSLSITSSKVVQDDPTTSSGGGGGGSGSSGEDYENIEVKDVVREQIVINEETSYEFKEESNAIETITFTALKNAGGISATVEVLKGRSALVKSDPSGKVYQNMNIWVGKSGFATSNNIADVKVGFKVEKSWIEENDIVVATIRLCRHHDDVWNPLPTKKSREDDKYIYFEAKTPGFSPFAITGSTEEDLIAQGDAGGSVTDAVPEEGGAQSLNESADVEEDDDGVSKVWYLVGALVIMLIGGGAYWMYGTKKYESRKSKEE
jgi:PGF-pre-PGF domain-containing protein